MARGIAKRKYKKIRKEFKHEIEEELKKNKALGMAILNDYIANKYRKHIKEMRRLLRTQYKDAYKAYCESGLSYKMLSEKEDLYETLFASGYKDIARKYFLILPENIAFGEIHVIVIKCINGML